MNWEKVDRALIEAAVPFEGKATAARDRHAVFPGAVLVVGRGGETVYSRAVGCRSLLPEVTAMQKDTVFDVASLTKVMVTVPLVMQAVEQGRLNVNKKLSEIVQTFATHGKERITIRHLLTHCSGFPATAPYYKRISKADTSDRLGIMTSRGAVDLIYGEILRSALDNLPGKVTKYSDIGFILLGNVLETISGMPLDKLAQRGIFQPLELRSTGYIDLTKIRRRGIAPITEMIAPTAECPWRHKILCGEVHDDNAWAMGGVAPHAGVFSTAEDVHAFAAEMINCYHGRSDFLHRELVRQFWTLDTTVPGSTWALGWDTPSPQGSSSGQFFSPNSVGHLGYTGCSLWIDPEREIDVVLLSNRIHPSVENNAIKEFRPMIHDLVMEALGFGR